jgi:hypothetical protein
LVGYGEVKFGKEFGPTSLLVSQDFGSHEVLQRIVISENLKRLIERKKVGTPPLKCPNNSQEFLVMDGIALNAVCRGCPLLGGRF